MAEEIEGKENQCLKPFSASRAIYNSRGKGGGAASKKFTKKNWNEEPFSRPVSGRGPIAPFGGGDAEASDVSTLTGKKWEEWGTTGGRGTPIPSTSQRKMVGKNLH